MEKELLEYLRRAGSEAGPVRAELAAEGDEERAELTVCLHEGRRQRAVYDSSRQTVSESIRKLRRERLVLVGEVQERGGEETVVDLDLTSEGERVAAMR